MIKINTKKVNWLSGEEEPITMRTNNNKILKLNNTKEVYLALNETCIQTWSHREPNGGSLYDGDIEFYEYQCNDWDIFYKMIKPFVESEF